LDNTSNLLVLGVYVKIFLYEFVQEKYRVG